MNEPIDRLILWGRCSSGRRWFWAATDLDGPAEHGWANDEDQATTDAQEAIGRLAGGQEVTCHTSHGHARHRLREINAERRAQRPSPDTAHAAPVEYLYGIAAGFDDVPDRVVAFQVTRKTAARVYYLRNERDGTVGFVDRAALERDGEVVTASAGWWAPHYRLYAAPPVLEQQRPEAPDLVALKAAMRDSHPDRGGSDEEFIAARKAYTAAARRA